MGQLARLGVECDVGGLFYNQSAAGIVVDSVSQADPVELTRRCRRVLPGQRYQPYPTDRVAPEAASVCLSNDKWHAVLPVNAGTNRFYRLQQ